MTTTSGSIPDAKLPRDLPAYSVLIPVYARAPAAALDECLDSIAAQALPASQVVIVEDGPIPAELDTAVQRWQSRLPLERVRLAAHAGLGPALNAGLAACRHALVGRMDADDIAMAQRFAGQVRHLAQHEQVHVLGGQIEEFGEGASGVRRVPLGHDSIRAHALYRNPMNHMTVCFRRDAIVRLGGYRDVPAMEDYDLWVRALGAGLRFANLPEVLVRARTGAAFYQRRRGFDYAGREWQLGKTKARQRLWPAWRVGLVTLLRALARLAPRGLIERLYAAALRERRP